MAFAELHQDLEALRKAGIRPTRQRVVIMSVLRASGPRHFTPEGFYRELSGAGLKLALSTVHNTLNQFADAGLVRRIGCGERAFFCTNAETHHHIYDEDGGWIEDLSGQQPLVNVLSELGVAMELVQVDVLVRVRRRHEV